MKKISAILLALIMMLSMVASAATTATGTNGSITITNAQIGTTYSIYRITGATLNADNTGTSYIIGNEDTWYSEVKDATDIFDIATPVGTADDLFYVSAKTDAAGISNWFKTVSNKHPADDSKIADSSTVEFTGLPYGYYIVVSDINAILTIDSANPSVNVIDKNQGPSVPGNAKVIITKDAQGNVTESLESTVNMGDVVDFQLQLNAKNYDGVDPVAQYTAQDTLGAGFTMITTGEKAPAVYLTQDNGARTKLDAAAYTLNATANGFEFSIDWWNKDAEGKVTTPKYAANTLIEIEYSATVDTDAVTGNTGSTLTNHGSWGNNYGDGNTTSYTYEFEVVKTDAEKNLLNGAEFKLYADKDCETEIVLTLDNGDYRLKLDGDTAADAIVVTNGNIVIKGLDEGNYYLKEIKAPEGYNLVAEPKLVEITKATGNLDATIDGTVYQDGGVQVVNVAGSELPSTGGIGTTIFYTVGGLMMAAAIVLLVAKKKVAASK